MPATHLGKVRLALAGLLLVGWAGACSENPGGPEVPAEPSLRGLVVSDPAAAPAAAGEGAAALSASAVEGDNLAYASLLLGTAPQGFVASVRSLASGSLVWTTVLDGGFDPVAVTAGVGDTIEIVVRDAAGAVVYVARTAVAPRRPPVVVRTDPPPRKRDVPLNAFLVIVFSEPVSAATLTPSSVRLFRGLFPVAGTVRLLPGSGTVAAFIPAAPLARNRDYRLVVSRGVRDLEGDLLEAGATVEFRTGQASTGPAASIDLAPDTVYMTGPTYQMAATVRDAAGNQLFDQPITWSTSDPSGLAVSPSGLLTALAAGPYYVFARLGALEAYAEVFFSAGPSTSVAISPTPATVAAGDTIELTATVRDAAGYPLSYPNVSWTSSDAALATVAADSSGTLGRASATVTGVGAGSVTITATNGTVSDTAAITVLPPQPVASVTVTPGSARLQAQETVQLSATLRGGNGRLIFGRLITWTSDNPAVATVDSNGLVRGWSGGSATVTATCEGVSGTSSVTLPRVASVTVTPESATVVRQGLAPLSATVRDANGGELFGRATKWTSGDPSVVTVDTNGLVTGVGAGSATVTAASEGVSNNSAITVVVINLSAVSPGDVHTCGLTTNGAAYCWGTDWPHDGPTYGRASTPTPVAGGLSFVTLAAGTAHTCGLTANGAAYCWGGNAFGQLGDGSTDDRTTPTLVRGGLSFVTLAAGNVHTCGVTTDGSAHCWGYNAEGELGVGATTGPESCLYGAPCSTVPVPVARGLAFSSVSAGDGYSCGVTTAGAAYCWGSNEGGRLGNGSGNGSGSPVPVAVSGGLAFSSVSAGYVHTCGVATSGAAYCWGSSAWGLTPVAVSGGLAFASVSVGNFHTCGVTTNGAAYCWGYGAFGQLGNGSTSDTSVPTAVAGGLAFSSVSTHARSFYTCGMSTSSVAYCWGGNVSGQLGDGSTTDSSVPVKVAGQP